MSPFHMVVVVVVLAWVCSVIIAFIVGKALGPHKEVLKLHQEARDLAKNVAFRATEGLKMYTDAQLALHEARSVVTQYNEAKVAVYNVFIPVLHALECIAWPERVRTADKWLLAQRLQSQNIEPNMLAAAAWARLHTILTEAGARPDSIGVMRASDDD